jgi:hypothetical protein
LRKGNTLRPTRKWHDSSTFGVIGCFTVSIGLLILAIYITLIILERLSPAGYKAGPNACRGTHH